MVQGEYMETVLSTKIKNFFPGLALLMAGFLAGLLIPNFIYCFSWKQQAFSAIYLLTAYGKTGAEGTDYLLKIIWMRGSFFFLSLLCGFTVFGVPIAVGAMLFTGLELGMVFSMSILQFGLTGGVVAAALLFPQYLIYLPALFMLLDMVFKQSISMWKNQGIFPDKVAGYSWQTVWTGGIYFLGMLLEAYVNPWITEKILMTLKIF